MICGAGESVLPWASSISCLCVQYPTMSEMYKVVGGRTWGWLDLCQECAAFEAHGADKSASFITELLRSAEFLESRSLVHIRIGC